MLGFSGFPPSVIVPAAAHLAKVVTAARAVILAAGTHGPGQDCQMSSYRTSPIVTLIGRLLAITRRV
jgi:hypothetical protein